jgi:molybdenum cofactor biosynthesis enzyme MoaA
MSRVDATLDDWDALRRELQVVEVELNTECNRTCSYCPQSLGVIAEEHTFITPEVWSALLGDLARIEFAGRFSHHFYGEPLLHPELPSLVRQAKRALPRAAHVMMATHFRHAS